LINGDPLLSTAFVDRNVHFLIYVALLRSDPKGTIVAGLATKWETASDGKTFTLTLRSGVKYQDGTDFDASSVKWNLDRYRTDAKSQRRGELGSVDSVTVVDPTTVKLNLKAPFSPLAAQLVDRAGMMLSQKAVEAGGADFTRKPVNAGTGPFAFVEAVKDDHITLEKNPDWWGKDKDGNKLPYLEKIIVKPIVEGTVRTTNLRTGDALVANNIVGKDVESLRSDPSLVYSQGPNYGFDSIYTNRKKGAAFEDGRYARAVSMAIDRQQIADQIFYGTRTPGYGTIAPSHFAADPTFKPFEKADPAGAKALIQQIGKPLQFE